MELNLFKTGNDFELMAREAMAVFDCVPRVVTNYVRTLEYIEQLQPKWKESSKTHEGLVEELGEAQKKIAQLEDSLSSARKKLEDEMVRRRRAEEEIKSCREQLRQARQVLNDESVGLNETAWARLSFLKSCGDYDHDRLDTIEEAETTGSVLTDLSYTRDEDDFLEEAEVLDSQPPARRNKRQLVEKENNDPSKRRKSTTFKSLEVKTGDRLVATTTVTVQPHGSCTATSTIENLATPTGVKTGPRMKRSEYVSDSHFVTGVGNQLDSDDDGISSKKGGSTSSLPLQFSPFSMNAINTRSHHFIQKVVLNRDPCSVCRKRFKFSEKAYKCKECKTLIHVQCQSNAPLPCVPVNGTPCKHFKEGGRIADYTPLTSPMVPALVIHCIKEIEARGLKEVGLYRIPGSDKEVKSLKEKFLRGRGVPKLSEIPDIHAVCGTLKEFLRSLKEPLITTIRWSDFVRAAEATDPEERKARLADIISELPQPNRDTLSYILLHLQRVSECKETMMGLDNLAVVFGQTIVGLSRKDPVEPYGEAKMANKVMLELLKLPGELYEAFIGSSDLDVPGSNTLQKTPSANSLKYFISSPLTVKPLRDVKYFETP